MTRRLYPRTLVNKSTDADGPKQTLTVGHVGLNSTPPLPDWASVGHVSVVGWVTGTLEIYQDGRMIYDDHGIVTNHPYAGATSAPLDVYFRVFDGQDYSPNVAVMTLTLQAALSGDVIPPTFPSMVPAAGATNVDALIAPVLHGSEPLQQGASGKTLVLRNVGANAIIKTYTIPGDLGSGAGQAQITDSDITIRPPAARPYGTQVSIRMDAGFVKDLAGNDCAAITDDSLSFTTTPAPSLTLYPDDPRGWRGRSPSLDFDPTGAIIVDAAGSGSYTTISAAMAAATAGSKIAVKAGVYPEAFTFKSGVTLQPWHTDRPILSAQQPVTGFVQCSAADAAVLGSVLGVAGSPVWKRTGLAKSLVPVTDLLGLAPMENWTPLFNAQDVADKSNPDRQEDESRFYDLAVNGGSYVMSGTNIVGVTDSTVLNGARYTNAQLLASKVRYYGSPNEIYIAQITSADVSAGTIGFASQGRVADGSGRKRFAIQNIAPAMVAGTYVYVDSGTTFDLYVYPYSPANVGAITMVARKTIITLPAAATDMVIQGCRFAIGSGPGLFEGTAITKTGAGGYSDNVRIEHNEFIGGANTGQLHYGQVWLVRVNNLVVQHNTFRWAMAHGVFPDGYSTAGAATTIRRNVFARCGSAAAKGYWQSKWAFIHNYIEKCGFRAHGNLANVYLGGVDIVFWGNEFEECQGYMTAQNVQNPSYCFNWAPCDDKYAALANRSNRKIENQGGTSGFSYLLNNSCPPVVLGAVGFGHMALNPGDPGITYYVANNIAHGMGIPADQQGTLGWVKCNLLTNNSHGGPTGGTLDPSDFDGSPGRFDTTNKFSTDMAALFVDYLNRDWRPASGSSLQKTMVVWDIASTITGYFIPTFAGNNYAAVPPGDFYIDAFGGPINYAALKMGADQSI